MFVGFEDRVDVVEIAILPGSGRVHSGRVSHGGSIYQLNTIQSTYIEKKSCGSSSCVHKHTQISILRIRSQLILIQALLR